MQPKILYPLTGHNPLVNHYVELKSNKTQSLYKDRFIPDGHASIVFNFVLHDTYIYTDKKIKLPRFFIVTPKILPLLVEIELPGESFIVVCKASVLSSLFNLNLSSATLAKPFLEADLFKGFDMFSKLSGLKDTNSRIEFFEKYLSENFNVSQHDSDEVDIIYSRILESEGSVELEDLIKQMKLNYRMLRRKFLHRTGISMKGLCRIVKVNSLWHKYLKQPDLKSQSLVYMGDFYVQPHLIPDFKIIVGEPPMAFLSGDMKKVKILSGVTV